MQNPSVVLYGPKNAKIEDIAIPEVVDPHDVIVRINYVGVCGSDVRPPPPPSPVSFAAMILIMRTKK
jgi:NADPH:quinone reductase-like Zn-dependent oxidoreductase